MKKFSREQSSLQKIAHRTVVFDVLVSAAFTDVKFLTCLMDPVITDLHHVLPGSQNDPYWAYPYENMYGKLLTGVHKTMIKVAPQDFCHNPYIVLIIFTSEKTFPLI